MASNSKIDKILYSPFFEFIVDICMIFFTSMGYFLQGYKFKKKKSSEGFSRNLCLLLLLANIIRIFFWIGKHFSNTLLYQSITVILSQIFLIHFYLEYRENSKKEKNSESSIYEHIINWKETLTPSKIWNWDNEIEYYKFILFLFIIFSIICIIVGLDNTPFFELLGTISVSIETFIELPQIRENCITKNTKNISWIMISIWLVGDLCRTGYNLIYHTPIQMIIGGILQNIEDFILTTQVIIYGEDCGILSKIFKKQYKYINLDDNENENDNFSEKDEDIKEIIEENNIDLDTNDSSKDNLEMLNYNKDNKNDSNEKISINKNNSNDENINNDTNIES
jgi:uncharacterized protein with PQ loop repeat